MSLISCLTNYLTAFKIKELLFIYSFLALLGLGCYMGFSLVAASGLFFVVASPEHRLNIVVHGLSCSVVCGIILNQGLNPCLLPCLVDCSPLSHQESPTNYFIPCLLLLYCVELSSPFFRVLSIEVTFHENRKEVLIDSLWKEFGF